MIDSDDTNIDLTIMDAWFSERVRERCTPHIESQVMHLLDVGARGMSWEDQLYLRVDFKRNSPLRADFFSSQQSRFDGYANHSWGGGPQKDTREFETMAPAYKIRGQSLDLALRILHTGSEDSDIEQAVKDTFSNLGDFTAFSLGYLRTRVLNARAQEVWGIKGADSELRKKNYGLVWGAISYLNTRVLGDLLEPSLPSSDLMPTLVSPSKDQPQYRN